MARRKIKEARPQPAIKSGPAAIDIPLNKLSKAARLRADVAAYKRIPQTADEIGLAKASDHPDLGDDDDWEAAHSS